MPTTLPSLIEDWLQASRGVFLQESLELYRGLLERHAVPWFGVRKAQGYGTERGQQTESGQQTGISTEEVRAFREAKLAEGLSESMVNTLVRLLQRVLDYGAGLGVCPKPEWDLSLRTPRRKRETVILSREEERRLVRYLTENVQPMHLCIFLILTTGMTVGEVMGVQWKDVSIKGNCIRVRVSRGPMLSRIDKTRKVPIGELQRIYLRQLAGEREDYLNSGGPKSRQIAAIESRWRKLSDALLLPPMPLTDLRHNFAVRLLESGLDYETVSGRLGVDNSRAFRAFYRKLNGRRDEIGAKL